MLFEHPQHDFRTHAAEPAQRDGACMAQRSVFMQMDGAWMGMDGAWMARLFERY